MMCCAVESSIRRRGHVVLREIQSGILYEFHVGTMQEIFDAIDL